MAISPVLKTTKQMWHSLSLEDVCGMIETDVAELRRLYSLQAEDAAEALRQERMPDPKIRTLIKAWEHAQDMHWSWYEELTNDRTTATEGP